MKRAGETRELKTIMSRATMTLRISRRGFPACCLLLTAAVLLCPEPAYAQSVRLQLAPLDKLAEKASEAVDIALDSETLRLAMRSLSDERPDEAAAKQLLAGVKGLYVRHYEFRKGSSFTDADVQAVRKQLSSGSWSRVISIRDGRELLELYTWLEGDQREGIAIVAAEAESRQVTNSELTIVNIVGRIDLEKLGAIEGQFGIPRLYLDRYLKWRKRQDRDEYHQRHDLKYREPQDRGAYQ